MAGLIDFENRDGIFPGVHRSYKFCLLTIGAAERADFSFFLTDAKQLEDAERKFSLTAEQIARINPNTKTAPVFRSRADAELTAKLYSRAPVLIEERPEEEGGDVNPWGLSFQTMGYLHMASRRPGRIRLVTEPGTGGLDSRGGRLDSRDCRGIGPASAPVRSQDDPPFRSSLGDVRCWVGRRRRRGSGYHAHREAEYKLRADASLLGPREGS